MEMDRTLRLLEPECLAGDALALHARVGPRLAAARAVQVEAEGARPAAALDAIGEHPLEEHARKGSVLFRHHDGKVTAAGAAERRFTPVATRMLEVDDEIGAAVAGQVELAHRLRPKLDPLAILFGAGRAGFGQHGA